MWEKVSKDSSSLTEDSDSNSSGEAVVNLVVKISCGQGNCLEPEKPQKENVKIVPSDDKACQAEEIIPTRNAATEVGESLTEKNSESDRKEKRVKRRGRRKDGVVKQYGCRCKQDRCLHCPMQRTSTVENLAERLPYMPMDDSSIHDETPCKSDRKEMRERSERLPLVSMDVSSIPSETPNKVRGVDESEPSGWSSTTYLSPPTQTKGNTY